MTLPFAGRGEPLTSRGLDAAAAELGCGLAAVGAVIEVETSGCGFLPDRRPKILFERHVFRRETGGRFDATAPDLSSATWGGYGDPGAYQYDRLARALALDRTAALRSCSWGLAQIMGHNAQTAGFADAEAMAAAFAASEDVQVAALARFCIAEGLDAALRDRRWTDFARRYNGPAYAANRYDERLAAAHDRLARSGPANLAVRAAQMHLLYLGYAPGAVDGDAGPRTRSAVASFQRDAGLPATGGLDAATIDRLRRDAMG
jgi:hypothetical protein